MGKRWPLFQEGRFLMKYADFIFANPIYICEVIDLSTLVDWVHWYFTNEHRKISGDFLAHESRNLYFSPPNAVMYDGTGPLEVTLNKTGQAQIIIKIDIFEQVKNSKSDDGKDWVDTKAIINLFAISGNRIEAQCIYNHSFYRYYMSEMFSSINARWPTVSEDKNIVIVDSKQVVSGQLPEPNRCKCGKPGRPTPQEDTKVIERLRNGDDSNEVRKDWDTARKNSTRPDLADPDRRFNQLKARAQEGRKGT